MNNDSCIKKNGKVGIVIITYNTWEVTIKCVDSILNNCSIPFHIYIVDNQSPNESYKKLSEHFVHSNLITVIQSNKNGGYSYGLNIGYRQALKDGCSYLIASNNDIIYLKNSIENMINLFNYDDKIAVVGSQLINNEGKRQVSAGDKHNFTKRIIQTTSLNKIFKKIIKETDYIDVKKPIEVFYVNGGCFMIKMEILKNLDGFDDNVFLYCEERILGTQIEKMGLKEFLHPNAGVIHDHSVTVKQGSPFSYINYCKSDLYYCKNYLNINASQVILLKGVRILVYILKSIFIKDFRKNLSSFLREYSKQK